MKKFIGTFLSLAVAATLVVPTSAFAAEVNEVEGMSIEDAVEEYNDIDGDDVETLEDAVTIVETEKDASESAVETETLVEGMMEYTTSTSVANFAGLGYSNNYAGPISIVKAILKDGNGNKKEVYLIGLSGTDFVENQATGVVTDILAGFNLCNPYLKATVKAIKENIPAGSNLILSGHSLGGMVAQEVAADSSIKKNYNVLNTVTFGTPLISALSREGVTKRLGDTNDIIPYLSANGVINPIRSIGGLNREDGGYGNVTNFWSAHMGSYCRTDVWGAYDVLGFKNGSATLTYDVSNVQYFKAPTAW